MPIDFDRCPYTDGDPAVKANRDRLDHAWQLLRDNPGREPGLMVGRMNATLWMADRSGIDEVNSRDGRDLSPSATARLVGLSTLWSRVVVVLAVLGTAIAFVRRHRGLAIVAGAGWLLLVIPLVSLGDPRFRVPSLPFFAIAAASLLPATSRRPQVADRLSPSQGSVGSLH